MKNNVGIVTVDDVPDFHVESLPFPIENDVVHACKTLKYPHSFVFLLYYQGSFPLRPKVFRRDFNVYRDVFLD